MVFFWCLCFKKKVHAEVLQQKYWPQACYHLLSSAFQKSKRKLFLCSWQKIIGSSENSSWKGLQEVSSPIFCYNDGQLWDQTKFYRALSSQALKISKGKNALPLCATCTTVLIVRKLFLLSRQTLSCFNIWPLSFIPLLCTAVKSLAASSWQPSRTYWKAANMSNVLVLVFTF